MSSCQCGSWALLADAAGVHSVFYALAYKVNAILGVRLFNQLGDRWGYFDSKVARDGLPDECVEVVSDAAQAVADLRPLSE